MAPTVRPIDRRVRAPPPELSDPRSNVRTQFDYTFESRWFFERMNDYCIEQRIETPTRKGTAMTALLTADTDFPARRTARPVRVEARDAVRRWPRTGPRTAGTRHRGTGVLMSRASHRRRPVTPAATVGLALLAALITVWLGAVAQFGAAANDPAAAGPTTAAATETLAVVEVNPGESLIELAARVAPNRSTEQVAQRIRDLNRLAGAEPRPGQTLIAPIA